METIPRTEAYTLEWPTNLKTAAEVAEATGISVDRISELADARYIPHYRIDDGPPLFKIAEVKRWVTMNLMERVEGRNLPIDVHVHHVTRPVHDPFVIPVEIADLVGHAHRIQTKALLGPGVYFLCADGRVMYVGQSVIPLSRIAQHANDGKNFDEVYVLPLPKSQLNDVEGAFIRALRPVLNGKVAPLGTPGVTDDRVFAEIKDRIVQVVAEASHENT